MTFRLMFGLALVALVNFSSLATDAASNPGSQHLGNLVGTWHCTYHSGGKTLTRTSTGTRLNDNWVQLKSPDTTTLVTYDAGHKHWVQFSAASSGNYGLATAQQLPTSTSLTWHAQYPADMRGNMSTITWPNARTRVIKSTGMQNGKTTHMDGVCSKI